MKMDVDILSVDSLRPMASFIKQHLIKYIENDGYGVDCIRHCDVDTYIKRLQGKSKYIDDWDDIIFKQLDKLNRKIAKMNRCDTDSGEDTDRREFESFFEAVKTLDYFYRYCYIAGKKYSDPITNLISIVIEQECINYVKTIRSGHEQCCV